MHCTRIFLCLIFAVGSAVGNSQPQARGGSASTQANDVAQATLALQVLFAAAERGDLKALDSLYAGDSLTVVEGAGIFDQGSIGEGDHRSLTRGNGAKLDAAGQ